MSEKRFLNLARLRTKGPMMREPVLGKVEWDYSEEASDLLGMSGAMLSGSKTEPEGQTVYWNACIFDKSERQIWHGDLNITKRRDELQELANRVGTIYVTPEQPFRFDGLKAGRKSRAAERILTFDAAPTQPNQETDST